MDAQPEKLPRLSQMVLVTIALTVLAVVCFPADIAITRAVSDPPRWVSELLENAEVFGNGYGVALIVGLVLVLDPGGRSATWRTALSATCGGLGANLLKLMVCRIRPRDVDLLVTSPQQTFEGWRWLVETSQTHHSFPSAHTATAMAFAWALSIQYPRGRAYFLLLAFLVGCQRVVVKAHFSSDVLAGAAVGALAGLAVVRICRKTASQTVSEVLKS